MPAAVHQADIELPSDSFLSAEGIRPAARSDHHGEGTEVARCQVAEGVARCRATGPALDLTAALGDGSAVRLGGPPALRHLVAGAHPSGAVRSDRPPVTFLGPDNQVSEYDAVLTAGAFE